MLGNANKAFELEVCIDSVASGIAAERGRADRIELCGSLELGGITPSLSLFEQVRRQVTLPLFVMLRPRFGDFCYSEEEFFALQAEAERFTAAGADGFVLGILRPDGTLDCKRTAATSRSHCIAVLTFAETRKRRFAPRKSLALRAF